MDLLSDPCLIRVHPWLKPLLERKRFVLTGLGLTSAVTDLELVAVRVLKKDGVIARAVIDT